MILAEFIKGNLLGIATATNATTATNQQAVANVATAAVAESEKLPADKTRITGIFIDLVNDLRSDPETTVNYLFDGIPSEVIAKLLINEMEPLDWQCIESGEIGRETLQAYARSILKSPWGTKTDIAGKIDELSKNR